MTLTPIKMKRKPGGQPVDYKASNPCFYSTSFGATKVDTRYIKTFIAGILKQAAEQEKTTLFYKTNRACYSFFGVVFPRPTLKYPLFIMKIICPFTKRIEAKNQPFVFKLVPLNRLFRFGYCLVLVTRLL